jgi:plasmid stabilization system protein ParE
MGYKVGLTDLARDDLGAAVRFIAVEGENPAAALRMGHDLLDVALSLAILPRRGSPVRSRPGMRKLSHRYWLIFYQVNEAEQWVEVVRIWDGRKDPMTLRLP